MFARIQFRSATSPGDMDLPGLLSGLSGINPEMALRLAKAFDTSPESWLNQQMQYDDLWQVEQSLGELKIERLVYAV